MKRLTAAAIALALMSASVAMADEHHDHGDWRNWSAEHRDFDRRGGDERRDWRDDRRDEEHDRWHDRREWQDRHDHEWSEGRFRDDDYRRAWGYREHEWRRGERLPVSYYAAPYVIGDYRAYGLREPPYGCRWIRVNNDVVLAAIATGVVLDVVYNAF
jgi:Ni/Co efflux regulator RcnB